MSTTITIRIEEDTKERLNRLAKATDRTISYLLGNAIELVLDEQEWQIGVIRERIKQADSPNATFIPHDEIAAWLKTWGSKKERKPPTAGRTEPPKCA